MRLAEVQASSSLMASQICFPLWTHNLLKHNNAPTFSSPRTFFSISLSSTQQQHPKSICNDPHKDALVSHCLSRRKLSLSILAVFWSSGLLPNMTKAILAGELELERYTDPTEGFTLLRPSSWTKVDKAGASVLFEEANKGSNSVGVVVNPVRLTSLGEFGSPQFVADKLIEAEKRKESTNDAEVISVAERSGQGGLQVYEFEYKVDSTRGGMKRIFSGAFVASKKLYLLNIAYSDKPENPLDIHTRMMLEQVLHSFDVAPVT
ncbi:psbP domain-containing protein 2, chloroplastic-like [Corylus avellana]|uniref:psbP domain-containing protein 2, chloroplastic-like n=1 Tax=Corylus avellana TaxID=13451 RepID=UPI00286B9B8D|nr:psbP domain-containing protein 2, chloroplastic-like [Corylus avellana]XP_059432945.1 psbP domain-containing protein 2, chloroplastic-like [Corylus avellana]XP_059432946.1 psbP domain-containing protein 2, chloroplastic-like [Corylus avellana]